MKNSLYIPLQLTKQFCQTLLVLINKYLYYQQMDYIHNGNQIHQLYHLQVYQIENAAEV